jgi:uncharacterized protein YerC
MLSDRFAFTQSPRTMPTPSLDRETFGRRLRSARKRFGWTLAEAAERSGVSITTISRAERTSTAGSGMRT